MTFVLPLSFISFDFPINLCNYHHNNIFFRIIEFSLVNFEPVKRQKKLKIAGFKAGDWGKQLCTAVNTLLGAEVRESVLTLPKRKEEEEVRFQSRL